MALDDVLEKSEADSPKGRLKAILQAGRTAVDDLMVAVSHREFRQVLDWDTKRLAKVGSLLKKIDRQRLRGVEAPVMRRASRAEIVQQLSKGRSAVADFSRNSATPEESDGPNRATNSAKGGQTGESAGDTEPETVHGFEHEPNASLTNVPGQNARINHACPVEKSYWPMPKKRQFLWSSRLSISTYSVIRERL